MSPGVRAPRQRASGVRKVETLQCFLLVTSSLKGLYRLLPKGDYKNHLSVPLLPKRLSHPFHPLYGQQFEILSYRHNWGEYRVTFYETPEHIRALPAAWTSLVPPDPSVILAAGRAAFRVADLLQLSQLLGRIEEGQKEEAAC